MSKVGPRLHNATRKNRVLVALVIWLDATTEEQDINECIDAHTGFRTGYAGTVS